MLACKLVVTGKSSKLPATIEPPTAPRAPTALTAPTWKRPVSQSHRSRQNASIVWDHLNGKPGIPEKWYWDNSTTPFSKRSISSLCTVHVSASSTTNLRTHVQLAHKDVVIKELKAYATLEVGKCVTLKSMKEDFGASEKYSDSFE